MDLRAGHFSRVGGKSYRLVVRTSLWKVQWAGGSHRPALKPGQRLLWGLTTLRKVNTSAWSPLATHRAADTTQGSGFDLHHSTESKKKEERKWEEGEGRSGLHREVCTHLYTYAYTYIPHIYAMRKENRSSVARVLA